MKTMWFLALTAGVLVVAGGCSEEKTDKGTDLKPEGPMAESKSELTHGKAVSTKASDDGEPIAATNGKPAEGHPVPIEEAVIHEIDESLHTISQKVAHLDETALKQYADVYLNLILNKEAELDRLAESLRALPMQDIVGEKGKELKKQVEQSSAQITELEKRYHIYLKALKERE